MKWDVVARTALVALRRNSMRAVLTALGIIIGIAAVIVMMAIGQGSSAAIRRTMESMGANNILVLPGTAASGGVSFGSGTVMTLTANDADALESSSTAIRGVAPVVRARTQIVYREKNWVPQSIQGTTPSYLTVRDWEKLEGGELFTERDVRNANRVCLIGQTIVRELFGDESPLGKEIRIQNVAFTVVGTLARKGANMMGADQDDIILAPWTSIKYRVSGATMAAATTPATATDGAKSSSSSLYPNVAVQLYPPTSSSSQGLNRRMENVDQILVASRSSADTPVALREISSILRARHRLSPDAPDDFTVRDMTEMTKALSSTTALMTTLLLSVAMISLVVGGVGIMNIMLVSVTERTREIGLRLAVGAWESDILRQFLVEAVFLCVAGGVTGIALGWGICWVITTFARWPVIFSLPAVAASFCVSVGVGLVFGYYPAARAARLDPIEALRYE